MEDKSKRILAIDFARGLSVLFMIPVHIMILYATLETWQGTPLGKFGQLLERGTPMFLVVMGLSFVFSHRDTMQDIIKRGIRILLTGYLLNIFRFIIPILFFGGLPEDLVTANGLTPGNSYNLKHFGLLGDILQLSGMSLVIMGIILKFIKNKYVALISALLIVAFSRELSGFRPGIPGLDYLCDLLWGNQFNVYFPVFPWMAFILIGLFFGMWYREKDKNSYYMFNTMLPFGIGFILLGGGLCFYSYEYHFGDYYHLGPGGTIILMGINLLLIWLSRIIVQRIPNSKFFNLLEYCSKNVTSFYFIQWVLIYWASTFFFGVWKQTSQLKLIAIMIVITLLTFVVLSIKLKVQAYLKQKFQTTKKVKQVIS